MEVIDYYYQILELKYDATNEEIINSYKNKIKKYTNLAFLNETQKVEVKDLSGAGDSFMAALVIEYLNTNNIEDAIKFANKKASEVVKHRGVTLI